MKQRRADREREARRLRAQGLRLRDIADQMAVAISTVDAYLNDPGGVKLRARKNGYRGICRDCGAPTDGSNGQRATPTRCHRCASIFQHESRTWVPERVVVALRAWALLLGRAPTAREAQRAGCPVPATVVRREFGSWRAGIRAAGLTPRPAGCYGRDGEDDALCREIAAKYESGKSPSELAREYGTTPIAIRYRVQKVGGHIRSQSDGIRLYWQQQKAERTLPPEQSVTSGSAHKRRPVHACDHSQVT